MKTNINEKFFTSNLSPTEQAQASRNIRNIKRQLDRDKEIELSLTALKTIIGIPLVLITIIFAIYCSNTGADAREILSNLQHNFFEWLWNLV